MRSLLVSSEMLAHWARAYNMTAHLRGHESSVDALRTNPKIAANVFEAFVGGLLEGKGLDAARGWLRELMDAQLAVTPEEDVPRLVATLEKRRKSESPPVPPVQDTANLSASLGANGGGGGGAKNRLSVLNERASQLNKLLVWAEEPQGPEHNRSWQLTVSGEYISSGVARER